MGIDSGTTLLQEGTLIVNGTLSGGGALITSPGTILAGSGMVSGMVNVSNQFNPGPLSGPGIFRAHGGLTLWTGSALTFDLSATDPANPAVNDSIEVQGNLIVNNNTITVNIGDTVAAGEVLGLVGSSGNSSAAHLHFAVYRNNRVVETFFDPDAYWHPDVPYQGSLEGQVMDSGLSIYDIGPDLAAEEAPVSTTTRRSLSRAAAWRMACSGSTSAKDIALRRSGRSRVTRPTWGRGLSRVTNGMGPPVARGPSVAPPVSRGCRIP